MHEALELLLADGVIEEVVARLKSGKEADVYVVSHGGKLVAAKIYKERNQRNFKNNAGYKEGRAVRNSRTARAIAKGSKFGQAAAEDAWKATESEALSKLHAAGVRVPTPVMFYEGVLLMELVSDGAGQPAARIVDALLDAASAGALYKDLRQQVVKMLCCDIIHGDLSAYNILLSDNGPTIIDFPQVVAAAANSQAEFFFRRDLDNLRLFFAGYDRSLLEREGDVAEIWRAYTRRELSPDFEPSGRGVPGGGRPQRGPGRAQPAHSREFQELVREVAPPAPVEEDEFAILRQGGGERPKVALMKQEPRGRGPRRGPGGGRGGGGGFGGGRGPGGPPRAAGGAHAGPRAAGGAGQGAPQHAGQRGAHGGAPQHAGQRGGAPHAGARGPQGGAPHAGARGPQGGAPQNAGHRGSPGGAPHAEHRGPQTGAQPHAGARGPQGGTPHAGARGPQGGAPHAENRGAQGGTAQQAGHRGAQGGAQHAGARGQQGGAPQHAAPAHGGSREQSGGAGPQGARGGAPHVGGRPHGQQGRGRPQEGASAQQGAPRHERAQQPHRGEGAPHAAHGHAASMHVSGHAPAAQHPRGHAPRTEGAPRGADSARGGGRPQGPHAGGHAPHGRQGPARHEPRAERPPQGGRPPRGPAVSYVARGAASSGKPSEES